MCARQAWLTPSEALVTYREGIIVRTAVARRYVSYAVMHEVREKNSQAHTVARSYIGQIEQERYLSLDDIECLASASNITIEELFKGL